MCTSSLCDCQSATENQYPRDRGLRCLRRTRGRTLRVASSPRRDIGTFAHIFGALGQPTTGSVGLTFTPILMRKLIVINLKLFLRHCPGHFGSRFDVVSAVCTHMTDDKRILNTDCATMSIPYYRLGNHLIYLGKLGKYFNFTL